MSELLKNREYRKKAMQEIIFELHNGKSVDEVKGRFQEIIKDLDPKEIALIEDEIIREGLPIEEVQRMCDVHATVFKESLEKAAEPQTPPGHPLYTFRAENRALEHLIKNGIEPLLDQFAASRGGQEHALVLQLAQKLNMLWEVDRHYSRKENLLFPYLEKYNVTAPPKVMWGVDDEIRTDLKEARAMAVKYHPAMKNTLINYVKGCINRVKEMIFKEEKILFPMAMESLSEEEWSSILEDSKQFGYCLIEPEQGWEPVNSKIMEKANTIDDENSGKHVKFDTGVLKPEEISLIFNHLPVDITFVDKDGVVKYFSNGSDRIFPRTRAIIGRKVENCHPPASVDIVEKLIQDFKEGRKDQESFWLHLGEKYVLIKYFAVRDSHNEFTGVLEVSQDISSIQNITGEKRLAD